MQPPFSRRTRSFPFHRLILYRLLRPPIRPHSKYRGTRFSIPTGRVSIQRAPIPLPLPMPPIRPSNTDTTHTQRRCNSIVFVRPDPAAHPLQYCFRSIVPPFSPTGSVPPPPRFVNVLSCSVTLLSNLLAAYSLTVPYLAPMILLLQSYRSPCPLVVVPCPPSGFNIRIISSFCT